MVRKTRSAKFFEPDILAHHFSLPLKPYLVILAALALSFLLFMHGIRGLRTEKVLKEGNNWQEIHIVWDWNKVIAWSRQYKSSREPEQENAEPTANNRDDGQK